MIRLTQIVSRTFWVGSGWRFSLPKCILCDTIQHNRDPPDRGVCPVVRQLAGSARKGAHRCPYPSPVARQPGQREAGGRMRLGTADRLRSRLAGVFPATRTDAGRPACRRRQANPGPGHRNGAEAGARAVGSCHGKDSNPTLGRSGTSGNRGGDGCVSGSGARRRRLRFGGSRLGGHRPRQGDDANRPRNGSRAGKPLQGVVVRRQPGVCHGAQGRSGAWFAFARYYGTCIGYRSSFPWVVARENFWDPPEVSSGKAKWLGRSTVKTPPDSWAVNQ